MCGLMGKADGEVAGMGVGSSCGDLGIGGATRLIHFFPARSFGSAGADTPVSCRGDGIPIIEIPTRTAQSIEDNGS